MVLISRYSLKPCSPRVGPVRSVWCRPTGDAEECAAVDGDAAGAHALGDPRCPFGVGATDFTGKPVNRVVAIATASSSVSYVAAAVTDFVQ